jgi:hypothetical protein
MIIFVWTAVIVYWMLVLFFFAPWIARRIKASLDRLQVPKGPPWV